MKALMTTIFLAPMVSGDQMIIKLLGMMSKWVIVGGGVLVVFGAIKLAGAMGDHDGQGIRQGVFQMAGGAVVSAAGAYLTTIV